MARIRLMIGDILVTAQLNKSRTAALLAKALPFDSKTLRWGDEVYFETPVAADEEDPQAEVPSGTVAYWPPGHALCLFFGQTPYSPVNVVGRIEGDPTVLARVEDGQPVRVVQGSTAPHKRTDETAVVVIPPPKCWEPIQAIRRKHDRQFRRWMPHITLLYPFRPRKQFATLATELRCACAQIAPLEIRLAQVEYFRHGPGRHTLWLAPDPPEGLIRLQAALQSIVPDCDDTARHAPGFTPHLSVGQAHGGDSAARSQAELQANWRPVSFAVREISLIWRNRPPDDVFRVDQVVALGR
jgi:2'-5' RNA ligase